MRILFQNCVSNTENFKLITLKIQEHKVSLFIVFYFGHKRLHNKCNVAQHNGINHKISFKMLIMPFNPFKIFTVSLEE